MWQEARFIAPTARPRVQVARQKIRRVGSEQQAIGGYAPPELAQMQAAALVADPAGDADVEPEPQVIIELCVVAREAMRDTAREPRPVLAQDSHERRVRVALMQENGLAAIDCELELAAENALLVGMRGEVAEIVQAAFADRANLR